MGYTWNVIYTFLTEPMAVVPMILGIICIAISVLIRKRATLAAARLAATATIVGVLLIIWALYSLAAIFSGCC